VSEGGNQYPSGLITPEGRWRWSFSSIEAVEGVVLRLGVRQWATSVLGTEKATPMSRPLAAMMEKSLGRRGMLPLWVGEATVIEKSSTYQINTLLDIDMCRGATYRRKRRGKISNPEGVPMETGEQWLPEPGNTSVHVLSHRNEDTQ